jgi:Fe2+ transport system protein FeoA
MTTTVPFVGEFIRLNDLPPRVCGIVRKIETDDEETQRLKMLGVCAGRRVELVRGGDPLILKVFGSRLGLAAALAARVHVEICAPEHCEPHEQFSA